MKEMIACFFLIAWGIFLGIWVTYDYKTEQIKALSEQLDSLRASASHSRNLPEVVWSSDQHSPASAPEQ